MIVCVCAAVSQSVFLQSLEEHGGDWRLAAMHSGAGQCCGTCRPFLAQVAAEHEARKTGDTGDREDGSPVQARIDLPLIQG